MPMIEHAFRCVCVHLFDLVLFPIAECRSASTTHVTGMIWVVWRREDQGVVGAMTQEAAGLVIQEAIGGRGQWQSPQRGQRRHETRQQGSSGRGDKTVGIVTATIQSLYGYPESTLGLKTWILGQTEALFLSINMCSKLLCMYKEP